MNYNQTLAWLYNRLPIYQRVGAPAMRLGLDQMNRLSAALGNPHRRLKCIHIAGTNGKGSTAHMLASVLQTAGYTVGLYTSPHLKDFRERIKINGQPIDKDIVVDFVNENRKSLQCVVSKGLFSRELHVDFGCSQIPRLWDYADNIDTIEFILSLD